ncbi:hypothetical protein AB9K34_04735 [Sedimentitalea sp. XS_ASV28]|uniref:hypothetical protein n=1 Tax=Sedimentitalea sp. XS_ASV28 TaxID=3241296 RepID=UPI00351542F5
MNPLHLFKRKAAQPERTGTDDDMADAEARPLLKLLEDARDILWDADRREETQQILNRIEQLPPRQGGAQRRAKLGVYKSLAHWRLTGELVPNYRNINEARIQLWELERDCPVFEFQKPFLAGIAATYPQAQGPNELSSLYQTIDSVKPTPRIDPEEGIVVIRRPGATRTLMMFPGIPYLMSNLTTCLLDRAIGQPLNANVIACFDKARLLYLGGIRQIGNRQQTLAYLHDLLDEFRDTQITAIGGSAGVYGALHMSCDLGIDHVIATSGPTSFELGVEAENRQHFNRAQAAAEAGELELIDLISVVKNSGIKRVDFFVGKYHEFDMSQMTALKDNTDIVVPHLYESDKHTVIVLTCPPSVPRS